MNTDFPLWLAMASFAVATSMAPGTSNTLLLASGVNFGFRASLPHALGVSLGSLVLGMAIGFGLRETSLLWPGLNPWMHLAALLYGLYLAHRTLQGMPISTPSLTTLPKPLTPMDAAASHWMSPQLWPLVLAYLGSFLPSQPATANIVAASLLLSALSFPCFCLWAYAGSRLQYPLSHPPLRRAFQRVIAMLLLGSMAPLLWRGVGG